MSSTTRGLRVFSPTAKKLLYEYSPVIKKELYPANFEEYQVEIEYLTLGDGITKLHLGPDIEVALSVKQTISIKD